MQEHYFQARTRGSTGQEHDFKCQDKRKHRPVIGPSGQDKMQHMHIADKRQHRPGIGPSGQDKKQHVQCRNRTFRPG
jgi:hypothetical protein